MDFDLLKMFIMPHYFYHRLNNIIKKVKLLHLNFLSLQKISNYICDFPLMYTNVLFYLLDSITLLYFESDGLLRNHTSTDRYWSNNHNSPNDLILSTKFFYFMTEVYNFIRVSFPQEKFNYIMTQFFKSLLYKIWIIFTFLSLSLTFEP